jgi:CRP-like cAMP-binding protein
MVNALPPVLPPADCVACLPEALSRVVQADPALAEIWHTLPQRRLQRGQVLLRLGEMPQHLWWIRQGLVRLYFLTPEGTERNRSFHAEGAWIGGGAPPIATPSPYVIEALEDTELLVLSYAALSAVVRDRPAVRAVFDEALGWLFLRQAAREAELLSEEPARRYERFLETSPQLAARLPLHHIASHLGITNVALSRIRRRLGMTGG